MLTLENTNIKTFVKRSYIFAKKEERIVEDYQTSKYLKIKN